MAEPRFCSDCKSEHIGLVPCGAKSFRERLLSAQVHGSVTPTKAKKDYWDDEVLKDIYGGKDKKTRREEMADATQGRGYTTMADLDRAVAND